ncbi:hypothetical protein VTN96DRAFT_82 [Rasamsonia emersonii]|uniref:tRNA-splicing endonuclease subunit Sen15 domain-containing protein n=1 Tax=Rasamsonia emersonii (strain ATCC 16479 / CBS 393.64 / IMI 116815) TaxID=1408163 RepID=A0A0F4YES7_RASE3|nr:hypothetical protein T310_9752 [Rasamsonia emersonii CBS 393.64]KKA16634.1 hypothetical protein T310_9752 [Rasamsonia emersonii CBS 393.64]
MSATTTTAPAPSSLTALISQSGAADPISALTTQILHNLQYQHLWTSLRIHKPSSPSSADGEAASSSSSSPEQLVSASAMPLISGIPPHRLYTHPDEQAYMLEIGLRDEDLLPERVFVLPTAKGQTWSLRKLAAVFDSLPEPDVPDSSSAADAVAADNKEKAAKLAKYYERRRKVNASKEWGGKRLLLAMVDRGIGGDGTVVYYIVQEGTVKPRQN